MMKFGKKIIPAVLFLALWLLIGTGGYAETTSYTAITNARLIDGTGSAPMDGVTILIKGDEFIAIGSKDQIDIPDNATIINVQGKVVIPGLVDAHVHFTYPPNPVEGLLNNDSISSFRAAHFLRRHLMGGITTVRDMASRGNVGVMAKKAYKEGILLGSRPIVVGQGITTTGGHASADYGIAIMADGPYEVRRAVRSQIQSGVDLIKFLPPFTKEEVEAAVDEAHARGKLITVHSGLVPKNEDLIRWSVNAGVDCIEHAFEIPDDAIAVMTEKKIYCVPTLGIITRVMNQRKEWGIDMAKEYESPIEIFKKLRNCGIRMATGTDALFQYTAEYPGMYFEEIESFVSNGYSPLEAIVAATKIGAEVCAASSSLGTIEKGKTADLLVLAGDPLKDIRELRNVRMIMQQGKIIKRGDFK